MLIRSLICTVFLSTLFCHPVFATGDDARDVAESGVIEFNRDIRPILSDNCFFCHGPDRNKREADLRLDTREGLHGADGSGGAIVSGRPDDSLLLQRVVSKDPEKLMPPASSGKSLTESQIQTLRRWVEQGGKYEGHWSFLPIRGELNAGVEHSPRVVAGKIDEIVQRELAANHLEFSLEADRITLLRRLNFDLIGLPPSPAEVTAFLADQSPDAYEKVVDRLLASPHFGERLAMWWLDLVRYADSVGYHGDQEMSVSPFRQYVVESFNANKPFDQFTLEQLSGDLMANSTREQKIASGYNRLGMMSAEGGVQDREYLAKYIAERVRNASGTWLGITLGCAECHDHKFDPLTTRDFYRFEAFFADIRERGLYSGANSDGNWGPYVKVPSAAQEAEIAALDAQLLKARRELDTETPELLAAQSEWERTQVAWTPLVPATMAALSGTVLTTRADGAILATGLNPNTETYTLTFSGLPVGVTAIRIDVLPDDSLPQRGPGRAGNGNFVLSELTIRTKLGDVETVVPLQSATATYEQTGAAGANPWGKWAVAAVIDGDEKGKTWGWAVMEQVGRPQAAVFETVADLTLGEGGTLTMQLDQNLDNPSHNIGCFRISAATSQRPLKAGEQLPASIAAITEIIEGQRTAEQKRELSGFYRTIAPLLNPVRAKIAELEQQKKVLEASIPSTLITESVEPRMVRILPRGNWMDESGEIVTPALPSALAAEATGDRRLNRLDLAQWIVSADNPLTSRVTVNRLWKLYLGAGLSRKLDDLGAQGEWPTHPELLDFLATEFRTSGWNLKHTIKSMLLSRVYRQSSLVSRALQEQDPFNRQLARQGRFRLDAELVRDNALEISGLLVKSIGGRSVRPYQPAGYWAYLNFPTREWQNSSGEDLYRRGLYTHWQRQYLHPSLLAFDAPSREECTADRNRSNTPLQSLVLLNDPSYVEAARAFAEKILREGGKTNRVKLNYAFQRAVSRDATDEEATVLETLLTSHLSEYEADVASAEAIISVGGRPISANLNRIELAAWTSVARTLLNLHEVVTRN